MQGQQKQNAGRAHLQAADWTAVKAHSPTHLVLLEALKE